MPTDPTPPGAGPHDEAVGAYLHRMEGSLQGLNSRIARLAIALGLSLDQEGVVERLIQQKLHPKPPSDVPYNGPDRRATRLPHTGPERRKNFLFEELRGLLVLRYEMERNFADQIGASATLDMMEHASSNMSRNGFSPGADGMNLKDLNRSS
jgi:hypothetical protein